VRARSWYLRTLGRGAGGYRTTKDSRNWLRTFGSETRASASTCTVSRPHVHQLEGHAGWRVHRRLQSPRPCHRADACLRMVALADPGAVRRHRVRARAHPRDGGGGPRIGFAGAMCSASSGGMTAVSSATAPRSPRRRRPSGRRRPSSRPAAAGPRGRRSRVRHRHRDQGQEQREHLPADHHAGGGAVVAGAHALGGHQRDHPGHEGECGLRIGRSRSCWPA
jgi:hypothetical protein